MVADHSLYDRRIKVDITHQSAVTEVFHWLFQDSQVGKLISAQELRISFHVKQNLLSEPNTCEIEINNLNQEQRKRLSQTGERWGLQLHVGYKDAVELLYLGDIRVVRNEKRGTDWVSKFLCGDGEHAMRTARHHKSYPPGTRYDKVLKDLMESTGLAGIQKALEAAGTNDPKMRKTALYSLVEFLKGTSIHGSSIENIKKISRSIGKQFSVQNGKLTLLGPNEVLSDPAVKLNPGSGLLGSPEPGEHGYYSAISLLQPGLIPGRRVIIDSEMLKGAQFRINKVEHTGDTHGNAWHSRLTELKPLENIQVKEVAGYR
jgi:hypothetical protein